MEMKGYKKEILEKYDEFNVEFDFKKKELLQKEIENILEKVRNPDAEDFYILGLVYYFIDEKVVEDANRNFALENFLKAYELDKNNFLACLYVAHCYQDKKDYERALNYYEWVDQEKLKDFAEWRYVKLVEQIGFCHFKLGRERIGRDMFEQVLAWYKNEEIRDLPVPTEIIECLDESDQIIIEIKKTEKYL